MIDVEKDWKASSAMSRPSFVTSVVAAAVGQRDTTAAAASTAGDAAAD